jgi:hypothetical protein
MASNAMKYTMYNELIALVQNRYETLCQALRMLGQQSRDITGKKDGSTNVASNIFVQGKENFLMETHSRAAATDI